MSDGCDSVLLIGADIVPTGTNMRAFCNADIDSLVDARLRSLLDGADYSLFNLETPLTDEDSPILKRGMNFRAPTAAVAGLKAINGGAFTLANNHIMDQGVEGLKSTITVLRENGIPFFGVGTNVGEAAQSLYFELGCKRVGVYGCAEHEFSIATETKAGANPFDPLESIDHVQRLATNCDYAIVLYHGGKEHFRYPSPMLRKRCRKLVENGADLVVCQHSHCVGCYEVWSGGTIVYGQGNFLFDDDESEFWQTSLLLRVQLTGNPEVDYIPLRKTGPSVSIAQGADAEKILADFFSRSKKIMEPGFLETEYKRFAMSHIDGYLKNGIPGNTTLLFRVVNRLLGRRLPSILTSKESLLGLMNVLECEAHSELFAAGLRERLDQRTR